MTLVRVDGEGEAGRLADPGEQLAEAGHGQRPAPLAGEQVGRGRHLLAPQAAQGAQLAAAQDVRRGPALLQPAHVQQALVEVERVPAQADELGDAQPVPVGEEGHGAVAVGIAAGAVTEGLPQPLDLLAGEELARAELRVRAPWRR